jgi:hypothetical protein
MGNFQLVVETEDTTARIAQDIIQDANRAQVGVKEIINILHAGAGNQKQSSVVALTGEKSTATFTLVSVAEDDAVTIGAVTLTAKDSPSGENQWQTGGASDAADAVTLAAAINAHSVLSKVVVATSASNVVTVTSIAIGIAANQIAISETGTTITASGSFLAGGTITGSVTYSLGL